MDPALPTPACKRSRPEEPAFNGVLDILWHSAWEAVILAFLVQIFGQIAFGMLGGLWRDMTPSLPPGLAWHPVAEAAPSPWTGLWEWLVPHKFAVIFGVLFVVKAGLRLAQYSPRSEHHRFALRMDSLTQRISDQWFKLLVLNAFGAWISAMVLQWAQRASFTEMLWRWIVLDLIHPILEALARIPGVGWVGSWLDWYGDNSFKFNFWLLYTAAICDDLGVPNLKSLGRWAWRRYVLQKPGTVAAPALPLANAGAAGTPAASVGAATAPAAITGSASTLSKPQPGIEPERGGE